MCKGSMTNSAVKRMIQKFEASGCLDDWPRRTRRSTSANAAQSVQEEIEIVVGSSMHGEVSDREVVRRTGIQYTTICVVLRCTHVGYPYKIQRHHELLFGVFMKRAVFTV